MAIRLSFCLCLTVKEIRQGNSIPTNRNRGVLRQYRDGVSIMNFHHSGERNRRDKSERGRYDSLEIAIAGGVTRPFEEHFVHDWEPKGFS